MLLHPTNKSIVLPNFLLNSNISFKITTEHGQNLIFFWCSQSEDKSSFYPLNNMSEEGSGQTDEEIITPATRTTTETVPLMNDDPEAGEIPTTTSSISSTKSTNSFRSTKSTRATSSFSSTSSTRARLWIMNEAGSGDFSDVDNLVIAESRGLGLGSAKGKHLTLE